MKKIFTLAIAFSVLLSFSACSSVPSNDPSEPVNGSVADNNVTTLEDPPAEPEGATPLSAIGEMSTLGDWEITVDKIEIMKSVPADYGSFEADEGNQYVVATITAKNVGTVAETFINSFGIYGEDIRCKMVYQGKYEYASSQLLAHSSDLHHQQLNPLTSLTGILAFQVVQEAIDNPSELVLDISLGDDSLVYPVN